jgi:CRP-like cAMP-binding protein
MTETKEKNNSLSSTRLFEDIPEDKLAKIAEGVRRKTLAARTAIFQQGDPGDSFYIITSGKVRVFTKGEKGVETELSLLGKGDCFGEMALLTDKARSANVETLEETHLLVLTRDQFDKTLKKDHTISLAFVKQMSNWLLRDEQKIQKETERQSLAPKISFLDYAIVIGASLLCGIIFNFVNPNSIPLVPKTWTHEPIASVVPSTVIEELHKGKAFLIDARPASFFEKEHIKGAVSIPLPLFEVMYMMEFSDVEKSRDIIVYGRSISSLYDRLVARKLILHGYKSTKILKGGLPAWKKEGYPVHP